MGKHGNPDLQLSKDKAKIGRQPTNIYAHSDDGDGGWPDLDEDDNGRYPW